MKRTCRNLLPVVLAVLLVAMAAPPVALGQKDSGEIAGIVHDSAGAVVPNAKIRVRDVDRGTETVVTTSAQGEYVASPLKIGRYSVTAEIVGFKKTVVGPIVVNIQERPEVDITLQVGSIHEVMTITSEGPQLQTETSELGDVVNGQQATTLPLNGRNFAQLAQLSAGVAPAEPGSRINASYGFSAGGARSAQNNFLLDGVDNNSNLADLLNETAFVIQPSVDAIAEFKVQTSAYSAEFGRGNGAILNAVIKSGTNDFHGDLYEFIRNEKLDARNAFDAFGRQPYKQNQFGATLGGPIIKNRTFFFGDYEGLRIRQATPFLELIPTPAEVPQVSGGVVAGGGDFSANLAGPTTFQDSSGQFGPVNSTYNVLDCNNQQTYLGEIFNTRQTQQLPKATGNFPTGFCGVPIGGYAGGLPTNVFPTGLIDPLAARLSAYWPAPNASIGGNNFLSDPHRQESRNNFDVRIDHKISDKDNAFGRFSYENQPSFIPPPFNNLLDGGGFFDGTEDNSYRSLALSEVHLFKSNVINELRLGYNRINSHRFQINSNQNISAQLDFPNVPYGPDNGGLPNITFGDGTAGIGSSTYLPSIEKQNSFVITDNLTWIRGHHSLKFGTEVRIEQFTIFQPAEARGSLDFSNDFTDNPAAPGTGGSSFATMLLGVADGGGITSLHDIDYRRQIYAGFAQDDWKANDRLTVNLGLRYELFGTVKEHNNEEGTFVFGPNSMLVPKGQNEALTQTLGMSIPIVHGTRGLISPDRNNFAPRIGFAFRAMDKLVIRSGYGIFYGGQENGPYSNPSPGFNPPFFSAESFSTPCGNLASNPNFAPGSALNCSVASLNLNGSNTLANGFPPTALSNPNAPELYSIEPNLRTPYNQQWHFGVQYQMPADTVLDVSYAGSRGLKLFGFYNGNEAVPATDPRFATLCTTNFGGLLGCPTAERRPAHAVAPGAPPGSTCNLSLTDDCDPVFDTSIATFRSNDVSNYNSLQVRFEKRPTHGLQFQAAYTWSHALDDASSASLGSQNAGDFRLQNDPLLEYGNSDFDVRQRFVLSYAYDLPFGKNKAFGGNASGVWNQIIGNWQVAGITIATTGNWYTPTDISTNLSTSDGGGEVASASRPNVIGNPNGHPCVPGTLFNTCAFATNTVVGSFGDAGRNIIQGPGTQNWDISLFKAFPISETKRLEFRAEFFNAFNHYDPEFDNPGSFNTNIATQHGLDETAAQTGCANGNTNSNCAFGFAQAAHDPRFIQFALKFYF
ncbi:MAG TPA: TonB-dependent receptor [Candidatus Acidoferrales bacterium]|nr:TonB-dependent receptor [Candidatus Acidoferrales bacterium]